MWHAVKKQYFSITEKWKAPTILYLSYSRNLFLCAHIIQFLDPNFGPAGTILLSTQASIQFSYSYDKCHHTPLAHALGYIGKGCKMRAASRITANLLLPNFWAKKSNILTWILHIFVGWKVTFRFHQLPKHSYSLPRQKSSGWWDSACWRSSSFQVSTTDPCLCSQIHPLKSIYMLFACSKLEWHQSSSYLCPWLCDTQTLGQALLPLCLAATKDTLPAADHTLPWLTCKHSRRLSHIARFACAP